MRFELKGDSIRLGQLLKAAGCVSSGVDAKMVIRMGEVKLNGQECLMRGKQVVRGDVVEYGGDRIEVV